MMRKLANKVSSSKQQTKNSDEEDILASEQHSSSSSADENPEQSLNVAHTVRRQKKCIELLRSFRNYYVKTKDPNSIINSSQAMEFMHEIFTNIKYLINESKDQINSLDILCDSELVIIFVNLFEYCLIGLELVANRKGNLMEDVLQLHHYLNSLSQLVWCLTNFSAKFRTNFDACNGTRALLDFIRNQTVVDNFIVYKRADLLKLDRNYSLMKALIGSLHNLSKTVSSSFQDLNATQTLILFVHKIKSENQTYLMPVYMTLANILTDKEIDELPDSVEIVERLVKKIKMCADLIADKKSSTPRVLIDLENGRKVSVCAICDSNGIQWDLIELIWGLYRIAANDKIKSYIYSSCNIKEIANRLITYGNLVEKEYAIMLLYQLSFDPEVARAIVNDKPLMKAISELSKMYQGRQECQELTKSCENLRWSLSTKSGRQRILSEPQQQQQAESSGMKQRKDASRKKQIMISYNTQSRELCLKIKSILEQMGYAIWIDIENIHGSSLEAMATAIENSDCILICMSEKYKLSPNCRAEAEYAFNIRKNFVPLIMQPNYKPDGWLGLILGAKIFVDFTKYSFDHAINKLKKELHQIFNGGKEETKMMTNNQPGQNSLHNSNQQLNNKDVNNTNNNNSSSRAAGNSLTNGEESFSNREIHITNNNNYNNNNDNTCSAIMSWNNEKVRKWLNEIAIDKRILNELANFDGEMLEELNRIRETASEYFYKSISKNSSVELSSVTNFSKHLRKLFN